MRAASQLPEGERTNVDDAPAPARNIYLNADDNDNE